LDAIRQAIDRDKIARQQHAELSELRRRYASLTPREREVLEWVVSGLLNKQIAAELGTREITVKVHRGQVMRKNAGRIVGGPGENGRTAAHPVRQATRVAYTKI